MNSDANSWSPLLAEEGDVSLEELQQFVGSAKPINRGPIAIVTSIAIISISATLFFLLRTSHSAHMMTALTNKTANNSLLPSSGEGHRLQSVPENNLHVKHDNRRLRLKKRSVFLSRRMQIAASSIVISNEQGNEKSPCANPAETSDLPYGIDAGRERGIAD